MCDKGRANLDPYADVIPRYAQMWKCMSWTYKHHKYHWQMTWKTVIEVWDTPFKQRRQLRTTNSASEQWTVAKLHISL